MSSILSLEDQARRALANAINAELLPSYQKMVRKQLNIHDYVFQCQSVLEKFRIADLAVESQQKLAADFASKLPDICLIVAALLSSSSSIISCESACTPFTQQIVSAAFPANLTALHLDRCVVSPWVLQTLSLAQCARSLRVLRLQVATSLSVVGDAPGFWLRFEQLEELVLKLSSFFPEHRFTLPLLREIAKCERLQRLELPIADETPLFEAVFEILLSPTALPSLRHLLDSVSCYKDSQIGFVLDLLRKRPNLERLEHLPFHFLSYQDSQVVELHRLCPNLDMLHVPCVGTRLLQLVGPLVCSHFTEIIIEAPPNEDLATVTLSIAALCPNVREATLRVELTTQLVPIILSNFSHLQKLFIVSEVATASEWRLPLSLKQVRVWYYHAPAPNSSDLLLKAVASQCPNIEEIDITEPPVQDVTVIRDMLASLPKLKFLKFMSDEDRTIEIRSSQLVQFPSSALAAVIRTFHYAPNLLQMKLNLDLEEDVELTKKMSPRVLSGLQTLSLHGMPWRKYCVRNLLTAFSSQLMRVNLSVPVKIDDAGLSDLSNLHALRLTKVKFSDDSLQRVLVSLPFLCDLKLVKCSGSIDPNLIQSSMLTQLSLEALQLEDDFDLRSDKLPSLQHLKCKNNTFMSDITVHQHPTLESLDFTNDKRSSPFTVMDCPRLVALHYSGDTVALRIESVPSLRIIRAQLPQCDVNSFVLDAPNVEFAFFGSRAEFKPICDAWAHEVGLSKHQNGYTFKSLNEESVEDLLELLRNN